MKHGPVDSAAVVEVDSPLAQAIVTMLHRRGCPAWTKAVDDGRDGDVVFVPRDRREEALRLIAEGMDELAVTQSKRQLSVQDSEDDEYAGHRMVLPRLRDAGVAILLVPLLVVVVSAVSIPARTAAILVVVGVMIVAVLRLRGRNDE